MADFLGTIHHEFTFTVQEGLDALEDLIWHIESFEQVSAEWQCMPQDANHTSRKGGALMHAHYICAAAWQQLSVDTIMPPQVRAAVPMYILTRKINAMGIKVVLSGEGADEALGGYLFFHKAPDAAEFHM